MKATGLFLLVFKMFHLSSKRLLQSLGKLKGFCCFCFPLRKVVQWTMPTTDSAAPLEEAIALASATACSIWAVIVKVLSSVSLSSRSKCSLIRALDVFSTIWSLIMSSNKGQLYTELWTHQLVKLSGETYSSSQRHSVWVQKMSLKPFMHRRRNHQLLAACRKSAEPPHQPCGLRQSTLPLILHFVGQS